MGKIVASLLFSVMLAMPALATFALVPADRVDEVPIERLLANLERNAQGLEPAQRWRAIGRLHLLAYLRQVSSLPVYRERPGDVAEGYVDDCAKLDAQAQGRASRDKVPAPRPGDRCEARTYTLGPRREIPSGAESETIAPDGHLSAAIAAYQNAKALEPGNLRTRLALAFGFDRAGSKPLARDELRFIAREGLRRLPHARGEHSDWDTHVVLSEAVEHFERIAKSGADKALIATLKARLEASPPAIYVTPILVPMTAEVSFEQLVDRSSTVAFDFTGQGEWLRLGWLNDNAAWLVWDPRDRQRVTSGFQLFGSTTWIASWDNGYLALGALDDDGDGRIAGEELRGLSLWHDANRNGVSEAGEVKPVGAHDIVALDYAHMRLDNDAWVSEAGVTFGSGETRPTFDWQLRRPLLMPAGN